MNDAIATTATVRLLRHTDRHLHEGSLINVFTQTHHVPLGLRQASVFSRNTTLHTSSTHVCGYTFRDFVRRTEFILFGLNHNWRGIYVVDDGNRTADRFTVTRVKHLALETKSKNTHAQRQEGNDH